MNTIKTKQKTLGVVREPKNKGWSQNVQIQNSVS